MTEEPKFKVGDRITNGRYIKLVVGINSDHPWYIFKDGTSERIKDIDKKYFLIENKELKKIKPKTLDPDNVIEWLTANVRLYASLNFLYGSDCPQGDVEVESLIKAFKKDFGL